MNAEQLHLPEAEPEPDPTPEPKAGIWHWGRLLVQDPTLTQEQIKEIANRTVSAGGTWSAMYWKMKKAGEL